MSRIAVEGLRDEWGETIEGTAGWFDPDAATGYSESQVWDGNNMVGKASGRQFGYERLYHTAGGRWVLNRDFTNEYNGPDRYFFLTEEDAQEWMVRAGCDEDEIAQAFPDLEAERGPGQPQIGTVRKITLPDQDWARLGDLADAAQVSRAEIVRRAVTDYLTTAS